MSDRILHKRSLTEGSIPTTASLENGELAVNVADGKIYLKKSGSNGESIQSAITTNSSTVGDITLTGSLFVSSSQTLSIIGQLTVTGLTSSLHGVADTASYIEWNNVDNRPIFTSESVFNNYTQSTDSRLGNLETESGSVRNELNNYSSSTDNRLFNIESTTASLNSSVDAIHIFTSSANSRFSQLEAESGSIRNTLNQYTQSNDLRVQSLEVESGSVRSRLSNIETFSSSQLILNPTFATTGSNSFKGDQSISGSTYVTGSLTVTQNTKFGDSFTDTHQFTGSFNSTGSFRVNRLTYPTVDNGEFSFIQTDGNGNLTLQYVNTLYELIYNAETTTITKGTPLYVSGSDGSTSKVYRADAANPLKMPVIYVSADNIAPAATGRGILLGLITGVNTTGYPPGTEIYVAPGGGWTSVRPTGSAIVQSLGLVTKESVGGHGVVLNPGPNSVPNLNTGHFWVGNGNWLPTPVPTSSFTTTSSFNEYTSSTNNRLNGLSVESGSIRSTLNQYTQSTDLRLVNIESNTGSYARIDTDNTFAGLQTFNNISVNGTASFGYIQSTTGSAKIIGDAFIILNNNVPSEPFAGIKVIDSGSVNVTSSLLWDGNFNHWIYENVSGSTYGAAGFMGGPRSTDINNILYPTQYRVLRSQGGDHLYDSNITDNDTNVEITIPLYVTTNITASTIQANTGFIGNLTGTAATASYVQWNSVDNKPLLVSGSVFNSYTASANNRLNNIELTTASINSSILQIRNFTESINLRVNSLELESGSVRSRLSNIELFSSSVNTKFTTLGSYTASIDTKFNTLATYTGSNDTTNLTQNSRLDQLSTASASAIIRLDNLELFSGSQNNKNATLETYTASIDSKFNTLGLYTASIDTKFNDLGSYTASIDTKFNTLSAYTSSIDSKFNDLSNYTASNDEKWNTLATYTGSNDTTNTTQNSRLDQLSTASGSAIIRLDNLESFTSSIDTTIKTKLNVEGVISGSDQLTASYDGRYELQGREILSGSVLNYIPVIVSQSSQILIDDVTGFSTFSSSVDSRLDNIETESGSIRTTFNLYTQSTDNRLNNLEITSESVNSSISNLNLFTSSVTYYKEAVSESNSYIITHNLNEDLPIVQVYDTDKEQVIPYKIKSNSVNQILVEFTTIFSGSVIVKV